MLEDRLHETCLRGRKGYERVKVVHEHHVGDELTASGVRFVLVPVFVPALEPHDHAV